MWDNVAPPSTKPHLNYRTVKVGKSGFEGWVIGAMNGLYCHQFHEVTKPCRALLSKGALPCVCETEGKPRIWRAYLPILTNKFKRWVVILSKTTALENQFTKLGDYVRVTKGKIKTDRVKVTVCGDKDTDKRFAEVWKTQPAVNIHRYLLHLWQDEELARFFKACDMPNNVPKLGRPGRPKKKPETEHAGKARDIVGTLADTFNRLMN